jgi:hypothetical protein
MSLSFERDSLMLSGSLRLWVYNISGSILFASYRGIKKIGSLKPSACKMSTIAATSALDFKAGLLERTVRSEYIHIQDTLGRRFYFCTEVDDFDNGVENAHLNKRT